MTAELRLTGQRGGQPLYCILLGKSACPTLRCLIMLGKVCLGCRARSLSRVERGVGACVVGSLEGSQDARCWIWGKVQVKGGCAQVGRIADKDAGSG